MPKLTSVTCPRWHARCRNSNMDPWEGGTLGFPVFLELFIENDWAAKGLNYDTVEENLPRPHPRPTSPHSNPYWRRI